VSVLFLLLSAIGSNRTYHYTESTQFCGQACHTPMKPEYTAYKFRRMHESLALNATSVQARAIT